jgi:adenine/guanine phosphoribosyltransferase-like PRPP-binding protein
MEAREILEKYDGFEEIWKATGGMYQCPKNSNGKRQGPLIGYAGTYEAGGKRLHFVGDAYFNFATIEEQPYLTEHFAIALATLIVRNLGQPDWVLGAPMGGIILAHRVAYHLNCRALYAEKKVISPSSGEQREQSTIVFNRHEPLPKTRGVIIDDVFHNYTTAAKLLDLAIKSHASVMGMAGPINRSSQTKFVKDGISYGAISLLHIPTPQFRQDDPDVTKDVKAGNVVWKPKTEWNRLREAMEKSDSE